VRGVAQRAEIWRFFGRTARAKQSTLCGRHRPDWDPELRKGEGLLRQQAAAQDGQPPEGRPQRSGAVPKTAASSPGSRSRKLQLAQIAPPIGWSLDRIYDLFPRLKKAPQAEGVTLSGGNKQMLRLPAPGPWHQVLCWDNPDEGCPRHRDEIEKNPVADQSQASLHSG